MHVVQVHTCAVPKSEPVFIELGYLVCRDTNLKISKSRWLPILSFWRLKKNLFCVELCQFNHKNASNIQTFFFSNNGKTWQNMSEKCMLCTCLSSYCQGNLKAGDLYKNDWEIQCVSGRLLNNLGEFNWYSLCMRASCCINWCQYWVG